MDLDMLLAGYSSQDSEVRSVTCHATDFTRSRSLRDMVVVMMKYDMEREIPSEADVQRSKLFIPAGIRDFSGHGMPRCLISCQVLSTCNTPRFLGMEKVMRLFCFFPFAEFSSEH